MNPEQATPETEPHLQTSGRVRSMRPGPSAGPLSGLRILDLTHALAGPYGSMFLADLGADVIKIERPEGELARYLGPFTRDDEVRHYGSRFAGRNRNKRSIALDLGTADDRDVFFELVATADGLIENHKAGVLDGLGVGYEACSAHNPRLVYAAIRGFGDPRTGVSPFASWPAFDNIAQAMGGIVSATGPSPAEPMRCGPPIGDTVPGLMAALGLVSAILWAQRTGEGQFVDVGMVDAMMSVSLESVSQWTYTGRPQAPSGNAMDSITPFDVFATADGHCAIAAPTPQHWTRLCQLIGRDDLITDERTATMSKRLKHRDLIESVFGDWMRERTTAMVLDVLGGEVPVGPVWGPADWVGNPHVEGRDMLVSVPHPHHRDTLQVNCPIHFTRTPADIRTSPPILDQHGDEIRDELASKRAMLRPPRET